MRSFDIGQVCRRAFGALQAGFGSVGMFLLAITLLTQAVQWVMQWAMVSRVESAGANADPGAAALAMFGSPFYWLAILASTVLGAIASGGAVAGYSRLVADRLVSFGECLSAGIVRFLPVLGLTLLWSLGIGFGFVLLVVPGVLLIIIWSVSLPALINERLGVFDAFARSRDLTRGSRPAVLVTLLILAVLVYVPLLVLGSAAISMGAEQIAKLAEGAIDYGTLIVSVIYGWYATMVVQAFLSAIYLELVKTKEGADTGELTEVFG